MRDTVRTPFEEPVADMANLNAVHDSDGRSITGHAAMAGETTPTSGHANGNSRAESVYFDKTRYFSACTCPEESVVRVS